MREIQLNKETQMFKHLLLATALFATPAFAGSDCVTPKMGYSQIIAGHPEAHFQYINPPQSWAVVTALSKQFHKENWMGSDAVYFVFLPQNPDIGVALFYNGCLLDGTHITKGDYEKIFWPK